MDSQVISQLIESVTETTGGLKLFEPEHSVVTLFDSSMILLNAIVQILVVSMQDLTTNDPANCLRVSRMFICRHPKRLLPCTID